MFNSDKGGNLLFCSFAAVLPSINVDFFFYQNKFNIMFSLFWEWVSMCEEYYSRRKYSSQIELKLI